MTGDLDNYPPLSIGPDMPDYTAPFVPDPSSIRERMFARARALGLIHSN